MQCATGSDRLVLHMAAMDLKKVVTQQVGKASSHVHGHWISLHDSHRGGDATFSAAILTMANACVHSCCCNATPQPMPQLPYTHLHEQTDAVATVRSCSYQFDDRRRLSVT